MSGAVKSVKKVFKKVIKPIKKVLPIALAVGAVVFTAGNALGAMPSWGEAVSSMTGTSTLGNILGGAITQAGYGAAIGAAGAAVTGNDITTGAGYGAAAGAITGGITGAMAPSTPGAPATPSAPGSPTSTPITQTPLPPPPSAGAGPVAANTAAAAAGGGNATGSGLLAPGGWLERNQELVGGLVGGVGKGLLASAESDDAGKQQIEIMRERQRQIAANYGTPSTGLLRQGDTGYIDDLGPYATPSQAFNYEYQFNPDTGRIEKVPSQTA